MKKVEKFFDPNRESPFFDYMKKVVVGQDVSWARRQWGPKLWVRTSLGQYPWGRTSWGRTLWGRTSLGQNSWGRTSWGKKLVGQNVVGQNVVGQDVTGAISLGQDVVGQDVGGAGRRGAELRGAGRRWGKISGAGGHGAEGSGAGSGSPLAYTQREISVTTKFLLARRTFLCRYFIPSQYSVCVLFVPLFSFLLGIIIR